MKSEMKKNQIKTKQKHQSKPNPKTPWKIKPRKPPIFTRLVSLAEFHQYTKLFCVAQAWRHFIRGPKIRRTCHFFPIVTKIQFINLSQSHHLHVYFPVTLNKEVAQTVGIVFPDLLYSSKVTLSSFWLLLGSVDCNCWKERTPSRIRPLNQCIPERAQCTQLNFSSPAVIWSFSVKLTMGWIYFIATNEGLVRWKMRIWVFHRGMFLIQLILIEKYTEKWLCIEITFNLRQ